MSDMLPKDEHLWNTLNLADRLRGASDGRIGLDEHEAQSLFQEAADEIERLDRAEGGQSNG